MQTRNLRVGTRTVNLEVLPLKNLKERCYLVFFEEAVESQAGRALPTAPSVQKVEQKGESRRLKELARELDETRDYLQSIREQYEAGNEELQASNEEVTSANEELQSINEELETSKEELESTNEELTTVNEEMANRNTELNRLSSDLNNLHVSINTPILLLGRDLSIRRFTPSAEIVFKLLATDVGRSLSSIKHTLDFADLEKFIAEVIDTVSIRERQVQDKEGHWYVVRVRPYLTIDNKVDGAVLMLVDINVLKQNEQEISSARDFAHAIIDSVPPLLILDANLHVQMANEAFYQTFGVKPAQTEHRLIFELGNGQWNIPALRKLLEELLPQKKWIHDYEVTHTFETIGQRTMIVNGRQIDHLQKIILSLVDITERRRVDDALVQAKAALERYANELEQRVGDRTAKLQEMVGELEHFSYTITHDMRAPLRAMQGFGKMLMEECADGLKPQHREFLRRIVESAGRMDSLITDALQYTKVIRQEIELHPVDAAALLRGIVESYPHFQPPKAEVQIEDNIPTVLGNEAGLTQCFSNLMNNAVKFTHPEQVPKIRVWGENRGDYVRLWFEDNGIGIAKEHQDQIFTMFQRLSKNYDGTGIGLALVRKVVTRMKGKVGVESEEGKGSRFWLELKRCD